LRPASRPREGRSGVLPAALPATLRVFGRQGIQVTPMAVPDVLHETKNWYGRIPGFETMCIETVKIVYYKLRGWI